MPTSNSLPFVVKSAPALQETGWEITVRDGITYQQVGGSDAVITDFVSLSIAPELNAPGAGSITMNLDSPMWSTLLANGQDPREWLNAFEHLWEVWQDGVVRFQFLGTNVDERYIEDDESRQITISGPGIAHMLSWACVLPPGYPPTQEEPPAGLEDPRTLKYIPRYPIDWPAMRIWLDQLRRAQARGTLPWISVSFTESADSGGTPWEVVQTPAEVADPATGIQLDLGTNLLDLLGVHTGQDLTRQFAERVEWYMRPWFWLDVQKTIGVHRENAVVFYEGGITTLERSRSRDDVANYVVTIDENGSTSFAYDTDSISRWNQREQLNTQNRNVTDSSRRQALTHLYLDLHKDEKDQWTIQVPYDQANRVPFIDYDIGDWIGVCRFNPTGTSTPSIYRVISIVVHVEGEQTTVELTLRTALQALQMSLQSQLTSLINGLASGVNTPPSNVVSTVSTDAGVSLWSTSKGDQVIGLPELVKNLETQGLSTSKMLSATISSGLTYNLTGDQSVTPLHLTLEPGRWLVTLDAGYDSDFPLLIRWAITATTGFTAHRVLANTLALSGACYYAAWNENAAYPQTDAYLDLALTERMWLNVSGTGTITPVFGMGVTGDLHLLAGTTLAAINSRA
jgi:hypothetical protein